MMDLLEREQIGIPKLAVPQRAGRRRWVDVLSIALLAVIVSYYSVAIIVVFQALKWCLWGANRIAGGPLAVAYLGLCLALGYVGITFLWRVVTGLPALVTQRHDGQDSVVEGLLLSQADYPELYDAASEVAAAIESPQPDEIWITHRAQCYVAEQRQFAMRTKRRLLLVLGLPNLSVLSMPELQAVLAHELAHFRRGDTTLGVFIFRFLESLRQSLESRPSWLRYVDPECLYTFFYFKLFFVLTLPLERQQELRADAVSAGLYGGDFAVRTLLKEWLLANQFDAEVAATVGETDANVFRSFRSHWRDFSPEGHAYLERRLAEEEQPSFWDGHPAMKTRIQLLHSLDGGRSPEAEQPAHLLLRDFSALEDRLQHHFLRQ